MEMTEDFIVRELGISPFHLVSVLLDCDKDALFSLSADIASRLYGKYNLDRIIELIEGVASYVEAQTGRPFPSGRRTALVRGALEGLFAEQYGSVDVFVGDELSDADMRGLGW